MNLRIAVVLLFFVGVTAGIARADQTKTDVVDRLESSTQTLQQIIDAPDKGIPDEVFKGARCVAVIPGMIKGRSLSVVSTAAVYPRAGCPTANGASAAAGPVGRHASAGTDWKASTEILTYSRAHGLFAGIDLGGSWIERDKDSTRALYAKDLTTTEILTGKVPVPQPARAFTAEVHRAKMRGQEAKRESGK